MVGGDGGVTFDHEPGEETRKATWHVFDLVPDALGKNAHQEFVDAAQALNEAAEALIDARTGEAAARLGLDLARWMAEATPPRFEQMAASRTFGRVMAERLAHQFRLRANDACVRAVDDVGTARRRTREAARLPDEAWQRFTEERRICNRHFQHRALAWLKKRETEYGRVAAATASSKRVLVKNVFQRTNQPPGSPGERPARGHLCRTLSTLRSVRTAKHSTLSKTRSRRQKTSGEPGAMRWNQSDS